LSEETAPAVSIDQLTGQIRQALPILGTLAVTLGWAAPDKVGAVVANLSLLVGPLMILAGIVWTALANTRKALLRSAAAVVGDNGQKTMIVASPELANATPENNIVSTASVKVSDK